MDQEQDGYIIYHSKGDASLRVPAAVWRKVMVLVQEHGRGRPTDEHGLEYAPTFQSKLDSTNFVTNTVRVAGKEFSERFTGDTLEAARTECDKAWAECVDAAEAHFALQEHVAALRTGESHAEIFELAAKLHNEPNTLLSVAQEILGAVRNCDLEALGARATPQLAQADAQARVAIIRVLRSSLRRFRTDPPPPPEPWCIASPRSKNLALCGKELIPGHHFTSIDHWFMFLQASNRMSIPACEKCQQLLKRAITLMERALEEKQRDNKG